MSNLEKFVLCNFLGLYSSSITLFLLLLFNIPIYYGISIYAFISMIFIFYNKNRIINMLDFNKQQKSNNRIYYFSIGLILIIMYFMFYRPSEYILNNGMDTTNYLLQALYSLKVNNLFNIDYLNHSDFFINAESPTTSFESNYYFPFPPLWKCVISLFLIIGGMKTILFLNIFMAIIVSFTFLIILKKLNITEKVEVFAFYVITQSSLILIFSRNLNCELFFLEILLLFGVVFLHIDFNCYADRRLIVLNSILISSLFLVRSDAIILYAGIIIALFIYRLNIKYAKELFDNFTLLIMCNSIIFWLISLYTTKVYMYDSIGDIFGKYTLLLYTLGLIIIPLVYKLYIYYSDRFNALKKYLEIIKYIPNIYVIIIILLFAVGLFFNILHLYIRIHFLLRY